MAARSAEFLIAFAGLVCVLVPLGVVYLLRARRLRGTSLESLLERLSHLDRGSMALIAADLHSSSDTCAEEELPMFEPAQIWDLIGGMEGLARMEANCAVLIDLASLLQERYPEALVVAEELRLHAREIRWHLDRLRGAARLGKVDGVFSDYAQRAIACYYGMTQRVLELYAWGDRNAHAQLAQVL